MSWIIVDRSGYFGEKRDELQAGFDRQYGAGKWRIAWQWGEQIVERSQALQFYEDGYYEYFKC
ncbi:hypothetical protein J4217_03175 [Candidatus Pacearchaeota archaeon]|nr:hypothetical protein [Candidatus Pacearchaeota archaeon]